MEGSTGLKKRVSDDSSSESTTKEKSTEISAKSSKKATSNERSRLFTIFQKLVCSKTNLPDDESEVMVIPASGSK